jgi:hypothetical protein
MHKCDGFNFRRSASLTEICRTRVQTSTFRVQKNIRYNWIEIGRVSYAWLYTNYQKNFVVRVCVCVCSYQSVLRI